MQTGVHIRLGYPQHLSCLTCRQAFTQHQQRYFTLPWRQFVDRGAYPPGQFLGRRQHWRLGRRIHDVFTR
jgi:hypothetical protein